MNPTNPSSVDATPEQVAPKSRIRWLRRGLIRLAMWRDPEARLPKDQADARASVERARAGSIEDELRLERGFYALRYLRGDHLKGPQ